MTTGPQKISATTVREQVYQQLRSLVIQGHFSQDYRFDLNQLSKDLGVSRTPLGAAIQQLKNEGLLVVKPRSGTFLNKLNEVDVREAFELRKILELGAVHLVLDKITDEDVARIESLNDEIKSLLAREDYQNQVEKIISLDKQIHDGFINASQHKLLIETYGRINTLLLVFRARRKFRIADSQRTIVEHDTIISALRGRDPTQIQAAIKLHLDGALERLLNTNTIARKGE
ncbi:MAG: GntR family transcriptional regulator [Rhodobacteraceae bacterium]|nr:GntR family transcriptional regulator [Paracoccaceae bacterium]